MYIVHGQLPHVIVANISIVTTLLGCRHLGMYIWCLFLSALLFQCFQSDLASLYRSVPYLADLDRGSVYVNVSDV